MNDGLVDQRVKRKVLEGLKEIVVNDSYQTNGDLKERRITIRHNSFFIIGWFRFHF